MHLAWRWFTGLGFDQEIPHHSTFSKNRHGRFQESKLFEQVFEEIVARCLEAGLVQGDNLSVDGSFVEANASKESRDSSEVGDAWVFVAIDAETKWESATGKPPINFFLRFVSESPRNTA